MSIFGLVLAGPAGATAPKPPPPHFPAGQPLGPPITLGWPKPGQVEFFSVTATGTLKPGAKPTFQPIAYGHPSTNERIAGGATKPKTAGGKTTITFVFAIKNIGTSRRAAGVDTAPTPQVDVFGNPAVWVNLLFGPTQPLTCAQAKKYYKSLAFLWAVYSFGDLPADMWAGALKSCP